MKFAIKCAQPDKQRTGLVIVGVFESRKLSKEARVIDKSSNGFLSAILKKGDLDGRIGEHLTLFDIPGIMADRVLLVGCGKEKSLAEQDYIDILSCLYDILPKINTSDAVCYLSQLPVKKFKLDQRIRFATEKLIQSFYRFDKPSSEKKPKINLKRITFTIGSRSEHSYAETALKLGQIIGEANTTCRDLGNTPGNLCTPTTLANKAKAMAKAYSKVSAQVYEPTELKKMGMNALLSVGHGSHQPTLLIDLDYQGSSKKEPPIILVGKGITFDSGGICLKPSPNMQDMKLDMCGAATVLAVFQAVAELKLPINLKVIVPTAENMPGLKATRPGDVVVTHSKKTVEIINTDAEGRLILCDALHYASQFKPKAVIDVATLTGAIIISLGHSYTGLFSNHGPLANELIKASHDSLDLAWKMPLHQDYQKAMKSDFADIRNIAKTPAAGSCVAAQFLSNFTSSYCWAHMDIAGTGMQQGHSTGRGVSLLVQYLLNQTG